MAPSFAGIFHNNAFKNGLLPIVIPRAKLLEWARLAENIPDGKWTLELSNQIITSPLQESVRFEVDDFKKYCMLNALDEIDLALKHERRKSFLGWRRLQDITSWSSIQIGRSLHYNGRERIKPRQFTP